MAQLVADLENLSIQWNWNSREGKRVANLHVWNAEMTELVEVVKIPNRVAEILSEHGMSSGS